MIEFGPSDLAWFTVVFILLGFVCVIIIVLWREGHGRNGLNGELEQRVTDLENDNVSIWAELKRLADRWIP